jgi:hypothetical protein
MEGEKLPGDYIAGFVDGEGCFALKFRRDVRNDRPGHPEYFYWDIEFAIMLKGTDKGILEMIRDTLECGSVSGPDKKGLVRFAVHKVSDIADKMIPFFEQYKLHAFKKDDFELWKQAVGIFHKNFLKKLRQDLWEEKDLDVLMGIKKQMEVYKGGNRHNWKWLR